MDIVKTREYHPPTDSNLEAAYADGFLHAVNNSSYDNPYREDIPEFHNAWIKGHEDGMDHTARPR